MEINLFFQIAVIIVSIVFHELSHGYAAYFLGDSTAKYEGRLTINPLKHLEVFGSIIVPLLTHALSGMVFGWAKPVPYNPYNLKIPRWGEVIVAAAGPLANLSIALIFSLYVRSLGAGIADSPTGDLALLIIIINLTLAIFNLIPIPPLDGFKIFWGILPYRLHHIRDFFQKHMLLFIIIFLFGFSFILNPIVTWLFQLFTGISLR
ncbi:MAG TPA: site-2 protease family protein [Candidatus Paceibacterota bacterium]